MKKILIILSFAIILLINGCSTLTKSQSGMYDIQSCENSVPFWIEDELRKNPDLNVEEFRTYLMNTYCGEEILPNGRILTENGYKVDIEYIWDEQNFHGAYMAWLRPTFEWIKNNTEEDARITSWWDYGAMIRAISLRDAVLPTPSKEFIEEQKRLNPELKSTYSEEELSNHSILKDVATILVTSDTQTAIELMNKHNSEYLLVTKKDLVISSIINREVTGNYTYIFEDSVLFQALNENLYGFDLIYGDDEAVIYKIK